MTTIALYCRYVHVGLSTFKAAMVCEDKAVVWRSVTEEPPRIFAQT